MELSALRNEDLPYYTVEDYLQWEGDWELIKGIPFAMAPSPKKKHQRISFYIAVQLDNLLSECNNDCVMYQAMDWQITEDTVVQPDVLVSC
ncbi:MAG: Uma2 family endonuclease, partial [bacterium]|nr:Uma2 family endonuclease [bacterium]